MRTRLWTLVTRRVDRVQINTRESAEDTKKFINKTRIITTIPQDRSWLIGSSMKVVIAKIFSPFAASKITPLVSSFSFKLTAVPPAQAKHIKDGTIIVPSTNSQIVRPREIRARNKPTKGATAIHQAR